MTALGPLARARDELLGRLGASVLEQDRPIGPLTTYRVGGPAALFVEVLDEADLRACTGMVAGAGIDVLVVGRGSNLLVADSGFPGLAIRLGPSFSEVTIDETTVRAGGAASLPVIARQTAKEGLTGFEWAVGVPGSIGGAVRMNAGGHGCQMEDPLVSVDLVDALDDECRHIAVDALDLAYRHSNLRPSDIVIRAELSLARAPVEQCEASIRDIVQWRRENQPGGHNAGSVFTNPEGDSAGRLIDGAGLKGRRQGTAEVSPKHANFIQCDEGGSADDVLALMTTVRRLVHEHHGVELSPETRLVGFSPGAVAELQSPLRR